MFYVFGSCFKTQAVNLVSDFFVLPFKLRLSKMQRQAVIPTSSMSSMVFFLRVGISSSSPRASQGMTSVNPGSSSTLPVHENRSDPISKKTVVCMYRQLGLSWNRHPLTIVLAGTDTHRQLYWQEQTPTDKCISMNRNPLASTGINRHP